ncbi:hypothetical protein T4D_6234 [Trichinella pseudospiralis]|uniref:Uncharacterized protein n=1 Tax=Trichinella pseudospiralis TaxID=6337 RepID=A0A0V1DMF2_TRIPS|nr:hypothetical protein T4D_6234 [Trichinella pseudospiralis]
MAPNCIEENQPYNNIGCDAKTELYQYHAMLLKDNGIWHDS